MEYTLEDLKDKYVKVGTPECKVFLDACAKLKIKWNDGTLATDFIPTAECIAISTIVRKLRHGCEGYYKGLGRVPFKLKHIRPEDEVTITLTYEDLAAALVTNANSYGGSLKLHNKLLKLFNINRYPLRKITGDIGVVDYTSVKQEVFELLFPQQPAESKHDKQVRELREQAELSLAKDKELESSTKGGNK